MASDIYFYRKDRRWQKVTKVTEVTLTGSRGTYSTVTGDETTDTVTITGSSLLDGATLIFTSITGGAGLTTGTTYYLINTSGSACKLSTSPGGSAVDFTTAITAGAVSITQPDMLVWSAEFRDIFTSTTLNSLDNNSDTAYLDEGENANLATPTSKNSDEVNHLPLRQTLLARTFWKFDRGASVSPRYLYAEYQQGDQVLDTPPETV